MIAVVAGCAISGFAAGGFPAVFGPATNVAWKTPVPAGNSSPVLVGPRVFLTAFADNQLLVVAHARADGALDGSPVGRLEALLGRSAQLPEQPVVAVEALEQRSSDALGGLGRGRRGRHGAYGG